MRPEPDRWAAFLARILPWFDQARWNRERAATRRVIDRANEEMRTPSSEQMRNAYRQYGGRLNGH